jgi:hypothetical protein
MHTAAASPCGRCLFHPSPMKRTHYSTAANPCGGATMWPSCCSACRNTHRTACFQGLYQTPLTTCPHPCSHAGPKDDSAHGMSELPLGASTITARGAVLGAPTGFFYPMLHLTACPCLPAAPGHPAPAPTPCQHLLAAGDPCAPPVLGSWWCGPSSWQEASGAASWRRGKGGTPCPRGDAFRDVSSSAGASQL